MTAKPDNPPASTFAILPVPDHLRAEVEAAVRRQSEFAEWIKQPGNEAKYIEQVARGIARLGAADDAMLAERTKTDDR